MPFDGENTAPSLTLLAEILRDKSRWPEGFEWDYRDCRRCAMGMAWRLWESEITRPYEDIVGPALGLSKRDAAALFYELAGSPTTVGWLIKAAKITPEHVADAIDAYLAKA